jgi:serine/threonine protein kinase
VCICDWGLCEYYGYPKQKKTYQCSRYYKAPDRRLSINVDLFSLGACIYYLFTGISVGYKETIIKDDIEKKSFIIRKILNNIEYSILKDLIKDERERPSAKRVLMQYYNFIPKYIDNHFDKIELLFNEFHKCVINNSYLYDEIYSNKLNLKRVKLEKKKLLLCTSLAIVVGKLVRCLVLLLLQFLSLCGNTILNFENIKK